MEAVVPDSTQTSITLSRSVSGGGSGFNPDQYNAQSFSFFNPSAMMTGRRRALSKFEHSNETGS